MSTWVVYPSDSDIVHYGVKGMKWKNKKGPGYNGMPSNIPNYKASKASTSAAKAGASAGNISKANKHPSNKPTSQPLKKKTVVMTTETRPINDVVQDNVTDMINGKKKIDRNYIIKNWSRIVSNPKLVATFKKRYPTAYSYVVKNQIGTSRKPINNHSGGSGGRH